MGTNYNKISNQNKNESRGLRSKTIVVDEIVNSHDVIAEDAKTNNFSGTSPVNPKPKKTKTGMIDNCPLLNLREKPDKNSKVLRVLNMQDRFVIEDISNGWAHIYTKDEIEGYVMKEYIKVE